MVLPVKNFEPNLSFSTFSLYYFHFGQPKHGVSKYTTSLPFSILLILLAGDVARNPGPINVCFCNMRSLRNKSAIIQDIVNCHSPDIFGVSETFLSSSEPDSLINDITPVGYNFFHNPRTNRRGGGVGCFLSTNFLGNPIDTPQFASFESLVVQVKNSNCCLYFLSVYRPPNSSQSAFLVDFQLFISFLSTLSSPIVITGDFNLHMDRSSPYSNGFKELLNSCDLKQHVDKPTHIHGHILDLVITPSDLQISGLHVGDCLSDHFLISFGIDLFFSTRSPSKEITLRHYHKINKESFVEDLKNTSFVLSPSDNVSDLYKQYLCDLSDLLDKHAPIISKTTSTKKRSWITEEFLTQKRIRRQCERLWRKYKTPLFRSRLRRQVSHCLSLATKLKSSLYTDIITSNCNNPKKLWTQLNSLLGRRSDIIIPDGDHKSLSDRFCLFFVNKIESIRNAFSDTNTAYIKPVSRPQVFEKFSHVFEDEVRMIIMNSPCKSCQLDPWPTFLVKEYIDILLPSITKMVNLSLKEGSFPDSFKQAIISPLLKKPSLDKNDFKNYRPVSGLPFISKIIEKMVALQIKNHLNMQNLHNLYQSAYKEGHSTETALLCVKSDIEDSLAMGLPTALVMLDLSAAFDTIDHTTLITCLTDWFGLSGTVLDWFTAYLSNRSQQVKIGGSLSDKINIPFGVPQGSVLGPFLFSLYTYPLCQIIKSYKNISYHFYADDTQLYCKLSSSTISTDLSNLSKCLSDVQNWMNSAKLKLNPDKTEFIVFGSESMMNMTKNHFPLDILGHLLSPINTVRNLGVVFDSSLSFSNHVSAVCRSCFASLRNLSHIRRYLPKSVAICVANALVSCKLDYCNSLFTSLSIADFNKLQCVQNSLARMIGGKRKYDHITPMRKSLHWLPVKSRCMFKVLTLIYKYLTFGTPAYFSSYIKLYSSYANTRNADHNKRLLSVPAFKSRKFSYVSKRRFDHSFMFCAPTWWNKLPLEIRTASTLSVFRRKLKTYLFDLAYPP